MAEGEPADPVTLPTQGGSNLAREAAQRARGEIRVLGHIFDRCHDSIVAARAFFAIGSPGARVPPDFLGALTANESAGAVNAARFEPVVFDRLKAVASGECVAFGTINALGLDQEVQEMLRPKACDFHAQFLTGEFLQAQRPTIAAMNDDLLRDLATSWGYTQIMGYHLIGRPGTVRDLMDPAYHYRLALDLLEGFVRQYGLNPAKQFEEMFRCWNSGQPHGRTYDPNYVGNGLRRMGVYRAVMAERRAAPAASKP